MIMLKCKMCGGNIVCDKTYGTCDSCGTTSTLPKIDDEKIANQYNRANHFRMQNDFDKAFSIYEQIIREDNTQAEAHWGAVLSRFGIEYVVDPKTEKRVPICHRTNFESVLNDIDYLDALKYTEDDITRSIYINEAEYIDGVQKKILEISRLESPYDIFICYKDSDKNGERTIDSSLAQDLYSALTNAGFKVFFSRISLENKLGQEYEPYIFAALNSAKVMLVLGTKVEYFNSPWVKNEWSRYLKLAKQNKSLLLIPCYKDMDAYELPEELSHLQSQNMSKIGFLQDLVYGIEKVVKKTTTNAPKNSNNEEPMMIRAWIYLENADFKNADEYFNRALDINPQNVMAYMGKLCVQCQCKGIESLETSGKIFLNSPNYKNALRFSSEKEHEWIKNIGANAERFCFEMAREDQYQKCSFDINNISHLPTNTQLIIYKNIANVLFNLGEYKNSKDLLKICDERITSIQNELAKKKKKNRNIALAISGAILLSVVIGVVAFMFKDEGTYSKAISLYENGEYIEANELFLEIYDYKDSGEYALLSFYMNGKELMSAGKFKEAAEVFETISDYEDSGEVLLECYYNDGLAQMESMNYEQAIESFTKSSEYADSKEKSSEAEYLYVLELISEDRLPETIEYFMDFNDERVHAYADAVYEKGISLINEGKKAEAAKYFCLISTQNDSADIWRELVNQTVTVGEYYFAGITENGRTVSTGSYEYDQINMSNWSDLVGISAGYQHTVGLKSDGTVVATGTNYDGRCNITGWRDVVQVAAADKYTVGLLSDGSVVAIGGIMMDNPNGWTGIVQIDACGDTTVGVDFSGNVYTTDFTLTEEVSTWENIIQVSTGGEYVMGLDKDGKIYFAGDSHDGIGEFQQIDGVKKISAARNHVALLLEDGTAIAWGFNDDGRSEVDSWTNLVDINAGIRHTIGLKADGTTVFVGADAYESYEMLSGREMYIEYTVNNWTNIKH